MCVCMLLVHSVLKIIWMDNFILSFLKNFMRENTVAIPTPDIFFHPVRIEVEHDVVYFLYSIFYCIMFFPMTRGPSDR